MIRGLVEEGALAKAAKHLISRGAADTRDPDVATKLRALHPHGPPVELGGNSTPPPYVDPALEMEAPEWARLVLQAVAGFPPGSAAGPSGLRPCHVKECLRRPGSCAALQSGLAAFTEAACLGKLPVAISGWMCASNLIAIQKKDGGIRPIAVGDCLRRVVGKTLLRTAEAKSQVSSLQPVWGWGAICVRDGWNGDASRRQHTPTRGMDTITYISFGEISRNFTKFH